MERPLILQGGDVRIHARLSAWGEATDENFVRKSLCAQCVNGRPLDKLDLVVASLNKRS